MTKAENSRVARNEPSADRIAADLVLTSWDHVETSDSAQPGGDAKPVAPNFSATLVIDDESDAGSYAQHIEDTKDMNGCNRVMHVWGER